MYEKHEKHNHQPTASGLPPLGHYIKKIKAVIMNYYYYRITKLTVNYPFWL